MKRHRLGVDIHSNLSGLAKQDTGLAYLEPGHVHHEDLQLQIVSDKLLVRVQDWTIIAEAEIIGRNTPNHIGEWGNICTHTNANWYHLSKMLRCRYTHWDQGFQCSFCGSLEQC
jgi:hypothetical protein